jgi:hypothetical protein
MISVAISATNTNAHTPRRTPLFQLIILRSPFLLCERFRRQTLIRLPCVNDVLSSEKPLYHCPRQILEAGFGFASSAPAALTRQEPDRRVSISPFVHFWTGFSGNGQWLGCVHLLRVNIYCVMLILDNGPLVAYVVSQQVWSGMAQSEASDAGDSWIFTDWDSRTAEKQWHWRPEVGRELP